MAEETHAEAMIARHQQVREFVERQHPDYYVTEIVERAKTVYQLPRNKPVAVLADASIDFHVETRPRKVGGEWVECNVVMLEDGSLRVMDTYVYREY